MAALRALALMALVAMAAASPASRKLLDIDVSSLIEAKESFINSTASAVHGVIAAKLAVIEDTLAKLTSVPEGKKLTVNKALVAQAKAASAALDSLKLDLPLKVNVPAVTFTKLDLPKVSVTKVQLPKLAVPKLDLALPKLELPKDLPKVQLPKLDVPQVQLTKVELPKDLPLPKVHLPKLDVPQVRLTKFELPKDLPLPKVTVSKLAVPTVPAPQLPLADVQAAVSKAISDLSHAGAQAAGVVGIKVQP